MGWRLPNPIPEKRWGFVLWNFSGLLSDSWVDLTAIGCSRTSRDKQDCQYSSGGIALDSRRGFCGSAGPSFEVWLASGQSPGAKHIERYWH